MDAISFVLGVRTRHLRSDRLQERMKLAICDAKAPKQEGLATSFRKDLEGTLFLVKIMVSCWISIGFH